MKIAVIPARGGSKRIPRKNIKTFAGKPMIAWSIEAAKDSALFDRIIVSTDDAEISDIAQSCGAEVPFVRPEALSDDHTPTAPVVSHAINFVQSQGQNPTEVCCLYATAPFVQAADLVGAFEVLAATHADYVLSITSFPFPIQRALKLGKAGSVSMFAPENFLTRSQDLEDAYHDAGQFYWGRAEAWLANAPIFQSNCQAYPLPRHRVQDIDTPEDWQRAELMHHAILASDRRET